MAQKSDHTARTVSWVMAITLIGKMLGLYRDRLLAVHYSVGMEANAFFTASRIPRVFFDAVFASAIAACFIGGTAVTGGIGTIPGAVIGAFVMGVINQGLSIMGVDTAVVKTIKGLVLLLAVAVDIMSKRKKS